MPRLAYAVVFFLATAVHAQPDWSELRRTVHAEMAETKTPGAAVAVIADNRVVFSEGFGVADIATPRPITSATRFRIGSLTKMFTAAAIVSLANDGVVSLDAPIGTYTPDLPPRLAELTFDQLLTHQGGVVDRLNRVELRDDDRFIEPGTLFSYSSLGYTLAGRAAASAAGVTFARLLHDRVFAPLGMNATNYDAGDGDSLGYRLREGKPRTVAPFEGDHLRPAGFLYSNADDLARFAVAFLNGTLDRRIISAMTQPRVAVPASTRRYGYGAIIETEAVYHMGDEPGASAFLKMIPSKHCAVIILTNLAGRMPRTMDTALRLAAGIAPEEKAKKEPVKLARADALELEGTYMNYSGFTIRRKGDSAIVKPWFPWFLAWLPIRRDIVKFGEDRFGIANTSLGPEPLEFSVVRGAEGQIEYVFLQGRAYKRRSARVRNS